jgi:hypothetical protein
LASPPKPADAKEWMDQQHEKVHEIATKAPGEGDDKEKETESDSDKATRPIGTSATIPVVLKDKKRHFGTLFSMLITSSQHVRPLTAVNGYATKGKTSSTPRLYIIYSYASSVSHIFTVFPIRRHFFGCLYIIVLLSTMFELVFNLGIMPSAHLSALSLLLFVDAMGIMGSRFSAISMSIVATSLSCITYALLPTIVGPGRMEVSRGGLLDLWWPRV